VPSEYGALLDEGEFLLFKVFDGKGKKICLLNNLWGLLLDRKLCEHNVLFLGGLSGFCCSVLF
jgi:hypothetical protein